MATTCHRVADSSGESGVKLTAAVLLLLSLVLSACTTAVVKEPGRRIGDGKYDSEFPSAPASAYLERIGESVKMLSCIAYYRVYPFSEQEKVRLESVSADLLSKKEREAYFVNSSSSGAATVIMYEARRVVLLTCAHIVAFPETVAAFYLNEHNRPTPYLRSLSVKERQSNYVAVFPERGELEVLAIDKAGDIALVGKQFETEPFTRISVFPYPFGAAKELEWGTFVYVFGYPAGFRMITHGIVSSPRKDRSDGFLLDAGFSRGFSGGIAVAMRDGLPNFELVGMIKLVSARTSYVLVPGPPDESIEYDAVTPYTGGIYVERRTELESSVTQAVSVESMQEFLLSQEETLRGKGYPTGHWLQPH